MISVTIRLLVLIALMPYTTSNRHGEYNVRKGEKKQVVVVPSHKSTHSSDVIVIGHGGAGSGGEGEQVDKDTISTLSNNVMSTTNLVHAQSTFIENLGHQLQKLQTSIKEQERTISKDTDKTKKHFIKLKDAIQNTTILVNALVLMWTKSERNYVNIVKKLKSKIEEGQALSAGNNRNWEQRFTALEKKLEIMQIGTDNARRLAVSKRSRWPGGKYCILANGNCPTGFNRQRAFLKTIYMYGTSKNYVQSMRIGSSYIGCYGKCGQYGSYATINIATCCK